jgi:hypothetical protein
MRRSILVLFCLVTGWFDADAQKAAMVEYPVKIVCDSPTRPVVAHGYYFTAINIFNAGADTAIIQHRLALTATAEKAGPEVSWQAVKLPPRRALEIDCTTMPSKIGQVTLPFRKGFAIIQSSRPLDIVAVYTAAAQQNSPISALEMERVPGHAIVVTQAGSPACPDLVVDSIGKPELITSAGATIVKVYVSNIGAATANTSLTRLEDLTPLTDVPPYQADATTATITAGAQRIVPFGMLLPKAGVRFQATADGANSVSECREDNNTKQYVVP